MALWSKEELTYLIDNSKLGAKQIAQDLRRTESSIIQKAHQLRISFKGQKLRPMVVYKKRSRDGGLKIWKSELPPFHQVMLGLWPNALDGKNGKQNRRLWQKRRLIILKIHDYACYYCGDPANTVDHILPRNKGGTDDKNNLVAACEECNFGWIQHIPWRNKYIMKKIQGV